MRVSSDPLRLSVSLFVLAIFAAGCQVDAWERCDSVQVGSEISSFPVKEDHPPTSYGFHVSGEKLYETCYGKNETIAGVDCSQYQSEAFELGGEYSTDCDIDQEFTPGGRGAMHCMAFTKEGKIVAVKGWCQD